MTLIITKIITLYLIWMHNYMLSSTVWKICITIVCSEYFRNRTLKLQSIIQNTSSETVDIGCMYYLKVLRYQVHCSIHAVDNAKSPYRLIKD